MPASASTAPVISSSSDTIVGSSSGATTPIVTAAIASSTPAAQLPLVASAAGGDGEIANQTPIGHVPGETMTAVAAAAVLTADTSLDKLQGAAAPAVAAATAPLAAVMAQQGLDFTTYSGAVGPSVAAPELTSACAASAVQAGQI